MRLWLQIEKHVEICIAIKSEIIECLKEVKATIYMYRNSLKEENIGFLAGLLIRMFVIPDLGMNLNKNA